MPLSVLLFRAEVFFLSAWIGEIFSFIAIVGPPPTLRLLNAWNDKSSSSEASVRNVRPFDCDCLFVDSASLSLLNVKDDDDDDDDDDSFSGFGTSKMDDLRFGTVWLWVFDVDCTFRGGSSNNDLSSRGSFGARLGSLEASRGSGFCANRCVWFNTRSFTYDVGNFGLP